MWRGGSKMGWGLVGGGIVPPQSQRQVNKKFAPILESEFFTLEYRERWLHVIERATPLCGI